METQVNEISHKENKRKGITWLILLIILLGIGLGGLIYMYFDQKTQMVKMQEVLTAEKDSLTHQLENLMFRYDTLKTSNDSLNHQIDQEKNHIKYLLRLRTSNVQRIILYKKEITTLRNIMKSYIRQIDSLNTRNKILVKKNKQISSKLQTAEKMKKELEKTKEDLTGKVQIASLIPAKNIKVTPLNKRGKEKYKIRKIFKLKICFTLRENPIVEAGNKTVYMRIQRPDSIVLAGPETGVIEIGGSKLAYSAKREVEYLNKDIDMCIFWDNNNSLIPGKYSVFLYLEGYEIGNSSFILK